MKAVFSRIKEPSTWAGIAAIVGIAFGIPQGTVDLAVQAVAGVAALLAVVLPEGQGDA